MVGGQLTPWDIYNYKEGQLAICDKPPFTIQSAVAAGRVEQGKPVPISFST